MWYRFNKIFTGQRWIDQPYVQVDSDGIITTISTENQKHAEKVDGIGIPGFRNAHSHAFQYALAGRTETHHPTHLKDNFWSWRTKMYELALSVEPEQLFSIARMLYTEMLRHGYTHVAEFHYLHHDKSGNHYSNKAELGQRLVQAANEVGIKITLIPMFYQKGGFNKSPESHQRRFISKSADEYVSLLEASNKVVNAIDGARLGCGVHSLRAVGAEDILHFFENRNKQHPFHLHVSEQKKEVNEALAHLNKRPVQWLLDNLQLDSTCHLVHATHLVNAELKGLAKSGTNVVLCPSTEGNLGDGFFRLKEYLELGGKWSIGTDSHIGLSPLEELRILDYGQRMLSHERNTLANANEPDSGTVAIKAALENGQLAMGLNHGAFLEVGNPLDLVVFDSDSPLLANCMEDSLLSAIMYTQNTHNIIGTLVNGKWKVQGQQTSNYNKIRDDFRRTLKALSVS